MLDDKAIQKIADLSREPRVITENGKRFMLVPGEHGSWDQNPLDHNVDPLVVTTLSAVVDYAQKAAATDLDIPGPGLGYLVIVVRHDSVVVHRGLEEDGTRQALLMARPYIMSEGAPNGFVAPDVMVLALLSGFHVTPASEALMAILTDVQSARVVESLDNGIAQDVTVRTKTSLNANAKLGSFHALVPRVFFPEVKPTEVTYLLRAKPGVNDQPPTFLLKQIDQTWQGEAAAKNAAYLREKLGADAIILA